MLVKAHQNSPVPGLRTAHSRIAFHGKSMDEVNAWLHKHRGQKFFVNGGAEELSVYVGAYTKGKLGHSEEHDALSARHAGWGAGTVGHPVMEPVVTASLRVSGASKLRWFIGVYGGEGRPRFLHNTKTLTKQPKPVPCSFALHQLLGAIAMPARKTPRRLKQKSTGGRRSRLSFVFGKKKK